MTDETMNRGSLPAWLIVCLAVASGATVANLYYAQPLIAPIAQSLGISVTHSGLIVTTIQAGYVVGLLLLSPLGDIVENKKLILAALCGVIVSLVAAMLAPSVSIFIAATLVLGFSTSVTQSILLVASHLAPDLRRGEIIGKVMSGLLLGILMARPVATLIAGIAGWHAVFGLSALVMTAITTMLAVMLPRRNPEAKTSYAALIGSLWTVLRDNPVLQRRSIYQALMFGSITLFFTSIPVLLQRPPFSLGTLGLSAFLFSGAIGVMVAPIVGRLADRGHSRLVTGLGIALSTTAFVLIYFGTTGSLIPLVCAGILLDAGVQCTLVTGQREIYKLPPAIRGRVNAIFVTSIFLGGGAGSALSAVVFSFGGLIPLSILGLIFAALLLVIYVTEFRW
jgi:predicted MFS family arabinose efflux permease